MGPAADFGAVRVRADGAAADQVVQMEAGTRQRLQAGDRIVGRLVQREGGPTLEGVWSEAAAQQPAVAEAARELRQDTLLRGAQAYREVGEAVPTFALVDHRNTVVTQADFRGRLTVVNFIFTRCQVPTMCPASTARLAELHRRVGEAGLAPVQFVSVTLDPAYDSPAVLAEYAAQRGLEGPDFRLLSGPFSAVGDLLRQFGILIAPSDNVLKHTASTLLIGPDGRIVYREDGSGWKVETFLEQIRERHVPVASS